MAQNVVVVTGAGSGIGRAVAHAFLAQGDRVILAGRRREALEETASLASGQGKSVVAPTDVSDPESVALLFDTVADTFGRLDLLFNNAGRGAPGVPLEDLSLETWSKVVAVNLPASFSALSTPCA